MSVISGYAATFNSDSNDLGFIEEIDPGAFDRTLANRADVRCLYNHDPNLLLGRSSAGTLRLRVDSRGLYYECDVNDADPDALSALAKVRRGDCSGSSFSFQTIRDQWDWNSSPPRRRLLEVDLLDVSPVTFPAYPSTTALARSMAAIASRAGKVLSAKTAAKIQQAYDHIQRGDHSLALAALREVLVDADNPDDETLLDQALEKDSVPQAEDLYALKRQIRARKDRQRQEAFADLRRDLFGLELAARVSRV